MQSIIRFRFVPVVLLLACSPLMAGAGAGLGDWYVIPAVANAPGSAGTYWRSDVQILNPSVTNSITVRVVDLVADVDNSNPWFVDYSIPPSTELVLVDVVSSELGRAGSGALVLSTSDGAGFLATSRTYNTGPSGTYGQTENGQKFTCQQGEVALIPGLRNGSGFRSNTGIVNTSDYEAKFYVDAFDSTGALRGTAAVTLKPWSQTQFSVAEFASAFSWGYLEISSQTTAVPIFWVAYASVIDNATGDAVFIEERLADWVTSCAVAGGAVRSEGPALPSGAKFDLTAPTAGAFGNRDPK